MKYTNVFLISEEGSLEQRSYPLRLQTDSRTSLTARSWP